MSFEAAAWAIRQAPKLPVEKLILIGMADAHNRSTKRCDPSMALLAEIGLCSERTAMRATNSLEQQGFITIQKEAGRRNRYQLQYDTRDNLSVVSEAAATSDTHVTPPVTPVSPEPVIPGKENHKDGDCPHQKIIDLYHEHCPDLPKVKRWAGTRERDLRARWKESEKHQSLDFWERYFKYVATSDFLMGRATDWKAHLGWLVNTNNFSKVIEGNYVNKQSARHF